MDVVISQLLAGISLGSVLLLASLGLSLTFGQLGVINNAHGEFMMAGAYAAYIVAGLIPYSGVSLLVALPAGFLVGGLLGAFLQVTLISRMRARPLDTLLATFGVGLVLQQLARDVFGAQPVYAVTPGWLSGPVWVAGVEVPATRVFILLVAVASLVGLYLVQQLTPLGREIRATVENRDLAETSGISTSFVDVLTFFIGSGIAGLAGVALTLMDAISFDFGSGYLVDAFLVVVAGGVGQLKGAVIAAFGLGIAQAFLEYWTDASAAKVIVLLLVVLLLQFRPQGLVSVRTRSLA
ncbi:urea ABC transporter permease subunit UrtB [Propionimicrobium sp. PCR01-08-3]|uniref:urea ABC transporter permease subunit UrtB n=1 Tax=Propionimicrobium sp. PCR01-08-3 TaxID=3052086 RepID=UPI00255CA15C|nr:urea ABC transporter permease subunit UrtB [Propionimicrobium sp. PCR01-08-3]WIY81963.1 urea ABC transporter permease subunit UrtB [Propionimicrobium sp. PCR01-08-3]